MSSNGADIIKFKQWAKEMGCPVQLLPSDDILKRWVNCLCSLTLLWLTHKSPIYTLQLKYRTIGTQQGQCLLELVRRVAPAEKVSTMRNNVLLHKLKTSSKTLLRLAKDRSGEIMTLHKVRECREELRITKEHNNERRIRLDGLRESSQKLSIILIAVSFRIGF